MKKIPLLITILLAIVSLSFAQNEQASITEKEFPYKDWTYKNLEGGGESNLRQFARDKKLVMVVYWAPWCANWRHDVAFVQQLHEKYGRLGLGVIGVGEYDSADKMRSFYNGNKLTFPTVYNSESLSKRTSTDHYQQRTAAGDLRKWGSPWYVFLEPTTLRPSGAVIAERSAVVNGELIKDQAEAYIKKKLGSLSAPTLSLTKANSTEVCDPKTSSSAIKTP